MQLSDFYENFKKGDYSDSRCFLCGTTTSKITKEHIFPKWILKKFSLFNQHLKLINGSNISYKKLTIPCCNKCNNEHLSKLEKKFKEIIDSNNNELTFNQEIIIFQWTAKILYATSYKKISLHINRSNIKDGFIFNQEELESYSSLHLFLQSIRYETKFSGINKPWSIFIFNCNDDSFYYKTNLDNLFLFIKLGKKAICVIFEDNNEIESKMKFMKKLQNFNLNINQVIETIAYLYYASSLRINAPKYHASFIESYLSISSFGNISFKNWDLDEFGINFYYLILESNIRVPDSIHQENFSKITFLVDNQGKNLIP